MYSLKSERSPPFGGLIFKIGGKHMKEKIWNQTIGGETK